ncbi:GNAT family N-acetyltransferase [Photobacterium leiognathi]|uniref:GNAT family N-acetyltransferase n=1 Tax=Photobacterium leiognathi TaxID=553611 RepID=UPI0027330461|nr:GNAT family N-acetyltransferase [Photobacterium leiognathi]
MTLIRKADKCDVSRIWEIRTQTILKTCVSHYSNEVVFSWANSPMPDDFDEILLSLGAIVLEEHEYIVGFGFVDTKNNSLESIFVDPRFTGRGFGKKIANNLIHKAKKSGLYNLRLSSSLNAIKFYESMGFVAGEKTSWKHPSGFELAYIPMTKVI